MLTRLRIANFKTLDDFDFEPTPGLSVFVGENGSGKSNLGDALQVLSSFARGDSIHELVRDSSRTRWAEKFALQFQLEFVENDTQLGYTLLVAIDQAGRVRVASEEGDFDGRPIFHSSGGAVTLPTVNLDRPIHHPYVDSNSYLDIAKGLKTTDEFPLSESNVRALHRLPQLISGLRVYRLEPSRMSGRSEAEDSVLDAQGTNFGSWYRWFRRVDPQKRLGSYLELASGPLSGLVDLDVVSAGQGVTETVAYFDIRGKQREFLFSELSDGQRQLLCLYLLNTSIETGQVLVFDEPDNFLSIREVQPWLSELEAVALERGAQVFIASHGTEAMDYLASRKAWLFTRPEGAGTRVKAVDRAEGVLPSEAILYGLSQETAAK